MAGTKKEFSYAKEHSIRVILEGQSPSGAYVAGPGFEQYRFCWFRDGSFIADAMSRVGHIKSSEVFFDWAAEIIHSRKQRVKGGEILRTRYTPEGGESDDEWPNFQLDGFGTLLWAIHTHAVRHNRPTKRWQEAIQITINYLVRRWREPCHDWWEDYSAIHPATLASIYAGLKAFSHPEADAVKAAIDLKNANLDASLIACATPFRVVTHEEFKPTLEQIEQRLVNKAGGVHRYPEDTYYGGGEWLLLTAFIGWHYAEIGRKDEAIKKLERIATHMDQNGRLPEQTSEYMLAPQAYETWVDKWGQPARPLLWSHGMLLTLASELKI